VLGIGIPVAPPLANRMEHGHALSRPVVGLCLALAAIVISACTAAPGPDLDPKRSTKASATAGRWQPPESNASGTYVGTNGEGCTGGLKSGTKQLGDQIKSQFSVSYGGYACRNMNNGSKNPKLSVHAVGRALDITAAGDVGDNIANHLVENAEALGVQLIIWNRTVWMISANGATSKQYTGSNPHTDHVHAEVTPATAANGPGEATSSSSSSGTTGTGTGTGTGQPPMYPNDEEGWEEGWDPGEDIECFTNADCGDSSLVCDYGWCMPK